MQERRCRYQPRRSGGEETTERSWRMGGQDEEGELMSTANFCEAGFGRVYNKSAITVSR